MKKKSTKTNQNFIFPLIKNEKQLKLFLLTENNTYTLFILNKIDKKLENIDSKPAHYHHIIPLHWKGPDAKWNLIPLSIEEHIYAHELLYSNYKSFFDLAAANMLQGKKQKSFFLIQK